MRFILAFSKWEHFKSNAHSEKSLGKSQCILMFRSEITVVLPFIKAAADRSISYTESFFLINSFL